MDDNEGQVQRALGRIEGKLDGIADRLDSGALRMGKLEDRVANNEKKLWYTAGATGIAAAISVIAVRMLPWAKLIG